MGKEIKKYYAVRKGLKPGIYFSWADCNKQVHKYPGAIFKSFPSLEEAEEFIKIPDKNENSSSNVKLNSSYAYIDGSFNKFTKYYGYGGFIMHNNQKYIIQGKGNDKNLAEMRNVAGEILACQEAVKKAIELGIKSIDIFYDYAGIEMWATGSWKRNKEGTKNYYEYMQSIKSKIDINFKKVKGHSGNEGNEIADKLAKEAAGIKDNNEVSLFKMEENENKDKKIEEKKNLISPSKIKHIRKNLKRKKKIINLGPNIKNVKLQILKKKLFKNKLLNLVEQKNEETLNK